MKDDIEKKINDFIIFCLESYKTKHNLTGKEANEIFNKYGVDEYLYNGFDMLHTQGEEYLMEDIDEFLKIRGFELH